ncbi:MAG TPA: NifU family protein [Candidatus Enterocloster faecavium]|uniref:NifU family protein n=1 Tax=Candidatus Enterocloster faecavium TaxID=2838560 RepID=A0A9D2RLD4_9FIRM|nr:NifU family protein [Candidatus Enterocloster faecavium]
MAEGIEQRIERILEEKVRGMLLEHEGGVQMKSFKEGILKISLTGHCAGCPSAQITTEEVVARAVKEEVPEVRDVVLVHDVSPELLSFAKKLLSHQADR